MNGQFHEGNVAAVLLSLKIARRKALSGPAEKAKGKISKANRIVLSLPIKTGFAQPLNSQCFTNFHINPCFKLQQPCVTLQQ